MATGARSLSSCAAAPSPDRPGLTISAILGAIAQRFPDRPAAIRSGRATSYGELAADAGRFGRALAGRGLGVRRERGSLENWQSGQAHVGLLMHNCVEYLIAEFGCVEARAVAINMNYRYVADELAYLVRDASIEAVVFHSRFAAGIAAVAAACSSLRHLIQVPDETGAALLAGACWYDDFLAEAQGRSVGSPADPDDLHILYTGGTTGKPKGVMWRQADILVTALGGRRPDGQESDLGDFMRSAEKTASRTLPAGPFMHASGRWVALSQLMLGNTVLLPDDTGHFDPADIWNTLERERGNGLNIVGDAMAQPLIAELRRGSYRLDALRQISSGAAVLSQTCKRELLELLPGVRISDTVGSSETGPQATTLVSRGAAGGGTAFTASAGTTILDEELRGLLPKIEGAVGWLARSGRMPLGYLADPDKTAASFRLVGGVRYAIPGDRARWSAEGDVELLGRDSSVINSGGEKIFAEEIEMALKHHAAVEDAVVCGRPSERWGQEVVAIVALRPGASADSPALLAECARHVARYKLPKAIVYVDRVYRSPSGKPDYEQARRIAMRGADVAEEGA